MDRPLVSIITVVYNAERHLLQFLTNIKCFKVANVELVIIDGRSTDQTLDILNQHSSIIDKQISEPDQGIYDAMNKGIKLAEGKWFLFLGVDDLLTDDFTSFLTELRDEKTIYYGDIIMSGKRIVRSAKPYKIAKDNISHQTIFYPREVFTQNTYDTKYKICADYKLNLELIAKREFPFKKLNLAPAIFGEQGISSIKTDELFEAHKPRMVLRLFGVTIYLRLRFKHLKAWLKGRK